MHVITSINALRKKLTFYRNQGKTIGFVPTMGYFHEGHQVLMRHAKKDHDICVVSLFVNAIQFGPSEDFKKYPRDMKRDTTIAQKENVDILFTPSDNEIYPDSYLTYVDVGQISNVLCGQFRPGHFQGVATVIVKLLNIVTPQAMYLGQKDAQQVAVIKKLVRDLNFDVTIKAIPTIREADGLAMSSRNVYLNSQERQEAAMLYQSMQHAKALMKKGERSAATIIKNITQMIQDQTSGKIQYVACVHPETLEPLKQLKGPVLIALAVYMGKTRLIDNIIINV